MYRSHRSGLAIAAISATAACCACAAAVSTPGPAAVSSTGAAAITAASEPPARTIITTALDVMGGEPRLRAIHDAHIKTISSWSSVERSERPEPPWNVNYSRTEQWLDYQHGAWREDGAFQSASLDTDEWTQFSQIVADGASAIKRDGQLKPGAPVMLADAREQLLYQPYRLVLAASDAADLRRAGDDMLAGQTHHIVAFHHDGLPIRLWIDARTGRLTAAEIIHPMPEDAFWRIRGDVTDRLVFSQWLLHPSGAWFARQYDLIRLGIPYHTAVITSVELNAATPTTFAIPGDVRAAYVATARGPASTPGPEEQPVVELAPGIWFAAARGNTLLIGQPAGAVLLDAPLSDVYFARTFDEVQHRFGKPPSAVVLTDHITPQLSGVREAAARGVTLDVLDANLGFVAALLAAPYTLAPDALARTPRRPKLTPISARTVLGDGATRVELIPMRTSLGERVMLAWLPVPRILWVASALALDRDGKATPSRRAELDAVIARDHLDVDRVVGPRLAPTSWASLHKPPAPIR
jgi:hypothetical protein